MIQQLQTSSQQKAIKHTQDTPQSNRDTGQPKVASPIFPNLHDTAEDGAHTQAVRLAKQYIFDATSGEQSGGLIAIILQFFGLNLGGSRFKQGFRNQCTSSQLRHYWYSPRKKTATPPKWCQRWVEAILRRFWNTAWDILTHRNIEIGVTGAWPAHTIALART